MKRLTAYFTKTELVLWFGSMTLILTAFCLFDRESYLTLIASLIGVTSLIFAAISAAEPEPSATTIM